MLEIKDPQEVCDLCCDAPTVDVNNQLIGQVFQWLINNDYIIVKEKEKKRYAYNAYKPYSIKR